jgi:hypothetical protein
VYNNPRKSAAKTVTLSAIRGKHFFLYLWENLKTKKMKINFVMVLVAALVPMVMGFIWYNPKVFGKAWMKSAEVTEEKMKGAKMGVIFALAFVFSFLLAFVMNFITIHQWGVFSMLSTDPKAVMDPATETGALFKSLMDKYGNNFRTFKHGALHGSMTAILVVLPVLGTNALFERKGFKYIMINFGFWFINLLIMGGLICAFP